MTGAPPRLLTLDARRSRARQAGTVAVLLAVARAVNPDRPLPIDVCVFHYVTGLPCPTCGLTRALCHALRGDWAVSLSYHPAGVLVAAALVSWMLWLAAEAVWGRPLAEAPRRELGALALGAGAVLSVVGWVVRLASSSF